MENELNDSKRAENEDIVENDPKSNVFLPMGEAIKSISSLDPTTELAFKLPLTPGIYFVVGAAKSSKTILMENLAFNLLNQNSSFLGIDCCNLGKVLYVSLEEFYNNRTRRNKLQIANISESMKKNIENKYFVLNQTYARFLSSEKLREQFLIDIKNSESELIIIDSFSRLYLGSIENSSEAQIVMRFIRKIAIECDIPIIIIHHMTKIKPGIPLTLNIVAGSRILAQESDGILGVGVSSQGRRYVKPLAFRYADDNWEKLPVYRVNSNCLIEYLGHFSEEEILRENDGRFDRSNFDQITNFIKSKNSVSSKELEEEFVHSKKMARSTMYDNLSKSKHICKLEKGVYGFIEENQILINDIKEEDE